MNRKGTYRLYRDLGLAVQRRKRKRIGLRAQAAGSQILSIAAGGWTSFPMLPIDGRKLRCPAIVDDYSRECLVLE